MTRVVIYCPDRHIEYDGHTPEKVGVGGGITARIRMAKALASLGHDVTMVVNCMERTVIDGVDYVPLDEVERLEGDIAIVNTSGGDLDLSPVFDTPLKTEKTIVWVHGTIYPGAFDRLDADCVYVVSNFIGEVVRMDWNVPSDKIFVVYNAFDDDVFRSAERETSDRDPFRLIYFSHPSKGLNAALGVLRMLRSVDPQYSLDVYGGYRLWGQQERHFDSEAGVEYHGLVGQQRLIQGLLRSAFSIQIQNREEPGALAIVEALRAGCVLVGSSVGCYPEYIKHGVNGFLISGDADAEDVQQKTADQILRLSSDPETLWAVSEQASAALWSSMTMARVWTAHWDYLLRGEITERSTCPLCEGVGLQMEDGLHCTECGKYTW